MREARDRKGPSRFRPSQKGMGAAFTTISPAGRRSRLGRSSVMMNFSISVQAWLKLLDGARQFDNIVGRWTGDPGFCIIYDNDYALEVYPIVDKFLCVIVDLWQACDDGYFSGLIDIGNAYDEDGIIFYSKQCRRF